MDIDTSIYQNIRPLEQADIGDSVMKGATLGQIGLQNQRIKQQMTAADQDQAYKAKDEAYKQHLQKASVFGNALESLSGLSPEERAAAYPKVREQLIADGVSQPQDMPEQHDEGFYRQTLMKYEQSKEHIDNQLSKAHANYFNAEAMKNRAEAGAQKPKDLMPGEKAADEVFGKDAGEYYYGGGKSTVEKNSQRLENAVDTLKANPGLTGGWTTRVPGLSTDIAQDSINPKLASVRDDIRGAIQSSLKQVLGGQYTEKEGEAIFNRAFNPRLSADENVRRATAEIESIKRMAAQKDQSMQQFMAAGTLKGYRPGGTMIAGGGAAPQAAIQTASASQGLGFSGDKSAYASPPPSQTISPQDMEAIHWAQKNKSDPRSQQILKMHGIK